MGQEGAGGLDVRTGLTWVGQSLDSLFPRLQCPSLLRGNLWGPAGGSWSRSAFGSRAGPCHTASALKHKRTLQNRHTGCGLSPRACRGFDWRRSSVSPEPNSVAWPPPTSQGKPVVGESTLGAGVPARASNFPRPLRSSFLPAVQGHSGWSLYPYRTDGTHSTPVYPKWTRTSWGCRSS